MYKQWCVYVYYTDVYMYTILCIMYKQWCVYVYNTVYYV